ncbi:hypothetical protein COT30_04145 [Candidatus Micrarchaeota archaeon CG08_land_8_20_14_0_20_49_17]|nr:MAG: hypothetical protein COT30_04145 [Candidatus Micrarchaeota archaeon CG08_land_8_20_14_0_20_49_17]
MGEKVSSEKIAKEDGYLYFLGKDGYVWRVPMKHNKKGSKKKVGSEQVTKTDGYMYYVDGAGYVARAKLKNFKK